MNFYFWKWSISEPYYKSARREVKVEQEQEQKHEVSEYDTQLNAINQSLSDDLDTPNNKREELLKSRKRESNDVIKKSILKENKFVLFIRHFYVRRFSQNITGISNSNPLWTIIFSSSEQIITKV